MNQLRECVNLIPKNEEFLVANHWLDHIDLWNEIPNQMNVYNI